ncbi:UDP-N-acetylmuramoyl-L-alanyl-D-glutamate--2,6-diaminopimelate ligase [Actinomycetaceae bacterium TAE3-ERU4]|nr:UDP-N-acetylmuramoyl-L-alanyl-D-glutamate--2,6-diaminopimelate ligase [Actinomycetaceae bacterium TAE3-ERU4]
MSSELSQLRPAAISALSLNAVKEIVVGDFAREYPFPDEPIISGISVSSSEVEPGYIFVALEGQKSNGWKFAPEAVSSGARAILTTRRGAAELLESGVDTPIIVCANPRSMAGKVAAEIYSNPSHSIKVYGITGTNGKSTSTRMLRAAFAPSPNSSQAGSIGTVGVDVGGIYLDSERTSLEAPLAHRVLAYAKEHGTKEVAIEVSSHAMCLERVKGIRFETVAFLNLQRDHLDFHGDMESYFHAKAKLFTAEFSNSGVVCVDDEWGRRLAKEAKIPVTTVSTNAAEADWVVENVEHIPGEVGMRFDLRDVFGGRSYSCHCPIPGFYNVQNLAVSLVIAAVSGHRVEECAERIEKNLLVPGRMEVVQERTAQRALTVVDYAHTTDALRAACEALREATLGRLILVFGATGDRDRGKRSQMGRAAYESAEISIVTEDDPYTEPVEQIRAEVLQGCPAWENVTTAEQAREVLDRLTLPLVLEIDNRGRAIDIALEISRPEDTVLIAGRGHETIQMVGDIPIYLDDRERARDFWSGRKENE